FEEPLLARDDPVQLRAGRRHPDRARERSVLYANAGDAGGLRVAVGDPPGEHPCIFELVPQKTEARREPCEADRVRLHIDDADLEQIARLGSLDVDGSREGVGYVQVQLRQVGRFGRGGDLPVDRVAALENDAFARTDASDRRYVGVPAVVAHLRLIRQTLRTIDTDALRRHGSAMISTTTCAMEERRCSRTIPCIRRYPPRTSIEHERSIARSSD